MSAGRIREGDDRRIEAFLTNCRTHESLRGAEEARDEEQSLTQKQRVSGDKRVSENADSPRGARSSQLRQNSDLFEDHHHNPSTLRQGILFAAADSEGFHLAVEVAALEAQQFGRAADVVAGLFDLFENVVAFIGVARLLQG